MYDDRTIARNVHQRLWHGLNRQSSNIAVTVDNGEVILSGMVDSWVPSGSVPTMGQKVRAENIVSQLPGALTLTNRIQVTGKKERASDAEIAAAIADEWFWSPYADSDRTTVAVTDGHAVIQGQAAGPHRARYRSRLL